MRILIRGTKDKGNAVFTAIVLIAVLSTTFIALVPRIGAVRRYAVEYKAKVLIDIQKENRKIIEKYELY